MPLQQVSVPAAPERKAPGPPPTDSLGAFVPSPSFTQGQGHPHQKPLLLGLGSMSQSARFGTHSTATDLHVPPHPLAIGIGPDLGSAEANGGRPKADAGVPYFGAWGKNTQGAGASSGARVPPCSGSCTHVRASGSIVSCCLAGLADTISSGSDLMPFLGCDAGPAAASSGAPAWGLTPAAATSFGKRAAYSGQQVPSISLPKQIMQQTSDTLHAVWWS
jgi:hypothetical protein